MANRACQNQANGYVAFSTTTNLPLMIKPTFFALLSATLLGNAHAAFSYTGSGALITDNNTSTPSGTSDYVTSSDMVFTGNIGGGSGLAIETEGTNSWIDCDRSTGKRDYYGEVTFTADYGYGINAFGFLPANIKMPDMNSYKEGAYKISIDVEYQINGYGEWFSRTIESSNATGYPDDFFNFSFNYLDLEAPASTLTVRFSNLQLNNVGGNEIFKNEWKVDRFTVLTSVTPFTPIPEPATATIGLLGLAWLLQKRRRLS